MASSLPPDALEHIDDLSIKEALGMSRSKSGLFARIEQAIRGRQKTKRSHYERRQFLRLESLEARTVLAGDAPVAFADGPFSVVEDQPLIVDAASGVLANDTDNDTDSGDNDLTAAITDNVNSGVLTFDLDDGSFVYTPNTDFVGEDSFTYVANDGTSDSNPITVTINVTAANDAPVAVDDAYSVQPDGVLNVAAALGVLANDTDVDDDESVLTAAQVGNAVNGSVTLNPNGSFTFTPTPGFSGIASFTYTAADDEPATSNTAQVTITVNAPPTVSDVLDQVTTDGAPITDLPFTIGDDQTDPAALSVTVTSDDQTLIPDGDINLGGSGASRTLTINPVAGQTGSATITITVTDANNVASTDTFLVTVNAGTAPTLADVVDQTTTEDNAIVDIPVTIGDAETDEDLLNLAVSSDNQTLIPDGNITLGGTGANRTVSINPALNQFGTATITLTVTDADGNAVTDTFLVTVTADNDDPTISDVTDQTTPLDTPIVDLPFTIADVDNDVATFQPTASSSNQSLIPDANIVVEGTGADRTVTITPLAGESGSAIITLMVDDGAGGTVTDTFEVTVSANTLPTIDDVPDQNTVEDQAIVDIPVVIGDVETDEAALQLTASSDNEFLIPNSAITFGGSGANRTVTITPVGNQSGAATITLTVTDGNGGIITDTFLVTVTADNDQPTISDVVNQTVVENGSISNLEVTVDDLETADDDLIVTATSSDTTLIPNGSIVVSTTGGTRTITITPAPGETGTATITLTVDDGNGRTAQDTFEVTVTANTEPTITAVTDQTTAEDTPLTDITVTVGDTETPAADLVVTATSSNESLIASGNINIVESGATRTISITPEANQFGTATITLTVADGNGGTAIETFLVTVTSSNDLPTIVAIADQNVAENGAITDLAVTIADVETDEADLELTGSSSNITLIPNGSIVFGGSGANRTVTITPAANQTGTSTITITVEDADGGTSQQTFLVTVTGTNASPTITAVTDQTTAEDTPLTNITFTVGDAETPAADVIVTASSSNTTLIPNNAIQITGDGADRTITITPAANQSGSATITLLVDDGDGGTVTEIFEVTVTAANDLPTISPVADLSTNEDTATGTITVTLTDVETPVADLLLTATSSNTTLVPNANIAISGNGGSRTIVVTPAANQAGTTTITLTVTDGNGGTSTETFVLTVTEVNDAPTAVNDTYTTAEDTVLNITAVSNGVLANDTDPENQALTTLLVLAPSSGQLVLNNNGTFTYTPALNFTGTVTFQYRARDTLAANSGIATVTINVTAANDAPTAVANGYTTSIGNTLTVNAASGVLANDSDPDSGTTLTAVLATNVSNGTLNLAADGSFTYTPNAGFSGTDSFTYRASDGSLQSSPVTVTIAVSAVNSGQPIIVGPSSGVRGQTLSYALSTIGGTSSNVTYSIDWNGDGTNDQTVTGPGNGTTVTHVFATSGSFNVRVQAGSPAQSATLGVTITDTQRVGSTFVVGGTSGNDTIVVQQVGRAGIRVLVNGTAVGGVQSGVRSVEVNGGDGNDIITMPAYVNASAIFRGGAGNDRLTGGKLADFLFGDGGDDILNGAGASDFLSGGVGNDSLVGGVGHDVLFGGDGVDSLVGGSHHNLMLGGTTEFDDNLKAQKAILHAWVAGGTFEQRMNRLNFKSKGGLKLIENDTVNRDSDADRIVSTGSRDWIFAAISDQDQVNAKRRGRVVSFL